VRRDAADRPDRQPTDPGPAPGSVGTAVALGTVNAGAWLRQQILARPELISITLLVGAWVVLALFEPAFVSFTNIGNMFAFIPEFGIVALGMTLLLTAGVFDLSVGSVFGFAALLMFMLTNDLAIAPELALLIALGASVLIGLANGILVARIGITSFLVTLGMALFVRGLALFVSEGFPEDTLTDGSALESVLTGSFDLGDLEVFAGLGWFAILAVAAWFLLARSPRGNWITATGGNERAAIARGVDTANVKIALFIVSAVLAAFAGIISATRIGSAYAISGTGYELEVIAMCVVGGTSLYGGRGTIIGTIIGVILLRSIRNGIIVIGVPGLAYNMFVGLIILAAVLIQALAERRGQGNL
jgi:simple sugar transport system permease protein